MSPTLFAKQRPSSPRDIPRGQGHVVGQVLGEGDHSRGERGREPHALRFGRAARHVGGPSHVSVSPHPRPVPPVEASGAPQWRASLSTETGVRTRVPYPLTTGHKQSQAIITVPRTVETPSPRPAWRFGDLAANKNGGQGEN